MSAEKVQAALDALTAAQDRHSDAMAEFEQQQADGTARGFFPIAYQRAKHEAVLSQRFLEKKLGEYRTALAEDAAPMLEGFE